MDQRISSKLAISEPMPEESPQYDPISDDLTIDDDWVREQYPRIHRAAWLMTGDPTDAEDLAQETFIVALDRWDSFEGRSTRQTWLYGILIRLCQHRRRSLAQAQTTVDLREIIARTVPATVAVKTNSNLPAGLLDQASRLDRFGDLGSRIRLRVDSMTSGYRTGFFVAPDLVLLSKESVTDETARLITTDGDQLEGRVVARDLVTGLVLVRVGTKSTHAIETHSDQVEVGLPVVVHYMREGKTPVSVTSMIGSYPDTHRSKLGFGFSVNSSLRPEAVGAPVLDHQGVLVGVVASGVDGMIFCLPVSHLLDRMTDGASDESPLALRRGRLGVAIEPDSESLGGVKISEVSNESAAENAGVEPGDVVVSVNQRYPCRTADDLLAAVAMFRSGDETSLTLKRNGEEFEKTVNLLSANVVDAVSVDRDVIEQIPGGFIFKDGKISRVDPDGKASTFNFNDLKLDNLQIERSAMEQAIKQLEQQVNKLREQMEATEDD